MKVCFYLGHPAHFHLFKNLFVELDNIGVEYLVLIKSKDVLENLMIENQIPYINIFEKKRSDNVFSILLSLLIKDLRILKEVSKFKPNILLGTSIELTHVGFVLRIPSLIVNEDDYDVVPQFAKLGYPFATKIIAPYSCRLGKWEPKRIGYVGYHEYAYLNSDKYIPKVTIAKSYKEKKNTPSIFVRLSNLNAYHDKGKKGLTIHDISKLINIFSDWNIFVSSEEDFNYEKFGIKSIQPNHVHDVLGHTDVFLGDSQTMTAEAALLGIVAIRYNDFVGEIGYLDELESKHQLAYGFKLDQKNDLFEFLKHVKSNISNLRERHKERLTIATEKFDDLNNLMLEAIYQYAK